MFSPPTTRLFWATKAGNSDEEYEDAGCMASDLSQNGTLSRFAVADGATETSFAGQWARALVSAYCQGLLEDGHLETTLCTLRIDWEESISQLSLPWFAEDKAKQGAFAALCGLTLRRNKNGRECKWQALALGDSCFFHLRGNSILSSFPLQRAGEFNNTPPLLSSILATCRKEKFLQAKGKAQAGDIILLCTDALACSLLSRKESNASHMNEVTTLQSQDAFLKFIADARNDLDAEGESRIKNDDVTCILIEV